MTIKPVHVAKLVRVALLCAGLLSLSACRYNFVPPVPKGALLRPLNLPVRLSEAHLQRQVIGGQATELVLDVQVGAPQPGYLSVVWYRQDSELGRDSRYIDARPQVQFRWPLDAGALGKGEYRAMLLFEGQLLREVDEGQ